MMSDSETHQITGASLAKGMIAGLIGGLVATAAKTFAERMYPPRTDGEPHPSAAVSQQISEHVTGERLSPAAELTASEGIDWAFGAIAGAAYGALVEFYPAATSKDGASFGLALGSLVHQGALPALGISAPEEDQSFRERTSEFSSHVVYGIVTETVRKFVRKML